MSLFIQRLVWKQLFSDFGDRVHGRDSSDKNNEQQRAVLYRV
jgi:hypothetical protein